MSCYIDNIICDNDITTDIKQLIPDANLRRRMSKIIKQSVSTAVECAGGIENVYNYDSIITATGWGCLADSENFLRNMVVNKEDMLNPTPFIQSTFNTPGGQIAILAHNNCYNVTYVNGGRSFEDAVLDAYMQIEEKESNRVLIGAFDENIDLAIRAMDFFHAYSQFNKGDGCVFLSINRKKSENSIAEITNIYFPRKPISKEKCQKQYCSRNESIVLYDDIKDCGIYPTASAKVFAKAVNLIKNGAREVVVCNSYWTNDRASIIVLKCLSYI